MKIAATVSTNVSQSCPFCRDGQLDGIKDFLGAVRHLQEVHKLSCLHVGQDSSNGFDGALWQSTLAVFGAEDPPAPLPDARVSYVDGKFLLEYPEDDQPSSEPVEE